MLDHALQQHISPPTLSLPTPYTHIQPYLPTAQMTQPSIADPTSLDNYKQLKHRRESIGFDSLLIGAGLIEADKRSQQQEEPAKVVLAVDMSSVASISSKAGSDAVSAPDNEDDDPMTAVSALLSIKSSPSSSNVLWSNKDKKSTKRRRASHDEMTHDKPKKSKVSTVRSSGAIRKRSLASAAEDDDETPADLSNIDAYIATLPSEFTMSQSTLKHVIISINLYRNTYLT